MSTLTYNEFRSLHKGTPQGELSELWKKYKAGEYEPDADKDGIHDSVDDEITVEETVETTEEVEEVEEEPEKTPEEIYKENLQTFVDSYTMLQKHSHRLSESDKLILRKRLLSAAKATRPLNYDCKPEDGWQLWVGPTPDALIVNERNQIAFCISRAWWMKNYQGSFLVQDMVLDDPNRVGVLREGFRKKGRLVLRNPIPGIEIMLPSSKLEAIVTSSHSYEG
tara:strand:+ start:1354 stop:2022 length:669 start_codon:yes stop_codon:yes gene_type:complete